MPLDAWFRAFLVTLACEVPLVVSLARKACPPPSRRVEAALLANIASHPAVWFVFPRLGLAWGMTTFISEVWALGVETWLYALVLVPGRVRAAVAISLAANAVSFGVGLLLGALGAL